MRKYQPKEKGLRGRMQRAAKMRGEGKSLREIAQVLQVHHSTVAADLRKWDAEQAKVSDLPVGKNAPGGDESTTRSDSQPDTAGAAVLPFKRPA